tara:strand:+ start:271 stop:1311 length:1041 start_codon:yes stop_codon:yes gene_type:complete
MDIVNYNLTFLENKLPIFDNMNINRVFVCIYKIVNNENITKPFLSYLLYKYPAGRNETFIFPFKYTKNQNPSIVANKLVKEITNEKVNKKGFIIDGNDTYFFYEDIDSNITVNYLKRDQELWWSIIDEICNKRKILNYNVHKTTYSIFYKNPNLLYLLDKSNQKIENPIVAYYGGPFQLIPYVSSMGLRANNTSIYGSYYYLGSYNYSAKHAIWTTNYKQRNLLEKNISDKNGKYYNGGVIRYVVFLKNMRYILYRPSDPFYKYIKSLDSVNENNKSVKNPDDWAKNNDSLSISTVKYKNLSGYFNVNSQYIIRNFNQQIPISCHELNLKNIGDVFDPLYENYNIL